MSIPFVFLFFVIANCFQLSSSFFTHERNFKYKKEPLYQQLSAPKDAEVRVRFAPSPTGSLHVGGARTALFNWLWARKTNGVFVVRVEDTDEVRSTRASENMILNDLRWLNMSWDEGPEVDGPHGPYRQSERKEIYTKVVNQLLEQGNAYRCFCTPEELEAQGKVAKANGKCFVYDGTWRDADPKEVQRRLDRGDPYSIRFKVPKGKVISFEDQVRGKVSWQVDKTMIGDFNLVRSSGVPLYNFCVSVDDVDMCITHVIRGQEHLDNTLKQLLVMDALGFKPPIYAHCGLVLATDKAKLSKRHGATSVLQFSEQGYLPNAMLNYLSVMGRSDKTVKNILSPEQLIQSFELQSVPKKGVVFDIERLRWFNAHHIKALPTEEMKEIVLNQLCKPTLPTQPIAGVGNSNTETEPTPSILLPNTPQLLPSSSQSTNEHSDFNRFLTVATKLAQRDMIVTIDTATIVGKYLHYNLENTLKTDPKAGEIVAHPIFRIVAQALVRDYKNKQFSLGSEVDFPARWDAYVKQLQSDVSTELGVSTADVSVGTVLHAIRLCVTGQVGGAELSDCVALITLASQPEVQKFLNPKFGTVMLEDRINEVKRLFC